MSLLLETIQIFNSEIQLLEFHNRRCNESRNKLFQCKDQLNLEEHILISQKYPGKWKCRILYNKTIRKCEIIPYASGKINSFKIVKADDLDYSYKFSDREIFKTLKDLNKDADELIILKNGLVTDTTYSNLAFFNGHSWLTPRNPLLKGVRRESLIQQKKILEKDISVVDIFKFQKLAMINSMNDLGEAEFPISLIKNY